MPVLSSSQTYECFTHGIPLARWNSGSPRNIIDSMASINHRTANLWHRQPCCVPHSRCDHRPVGGIKTKATTKKEQRRKTKKKPTKSIPDRSTERWNPFAKHSNSNNVTNLYFISSLSFQMVSHQFSCDFFVVFFFVGEIDSQATHKTMQNNKLKKKKWKKKKKKRSSSSEYLSHTLTNTFSVRSNNYAVASSVPTIGNGRLHFFGFAQQQHRFYRLCLILSWPRRPDNPTIVDGLTVLW